MPSCEISWSKNVNEKGKKTSFYLIYNISIWATWLENPFHDDKLNINL